MIGYIDDEGVMHIKVDTHSEKLYAPDGKADTGIGEFPVSKHYMPCGSCSRVLAVDSNSQVYVCESCGRTHIHI